MHYLYNRLKQTHLLLTEWLTGNCAFYLFAPVEFWDKCVVNNVGLVREENMQNRKYINAGISLLPVPANNDLHMEIVDRKQKEIMC